jgi:hypothetical protein
MTGRKRKFSDLVRKRVPFWKRFTVNLFHSESGGWAFRIIAGFLWFAIRRNYTLDLRYWDAESGIEGGYVPWGLKYGDKLPVWRWMKVTRRYSEYQP